jgi:DNA (cytosine-5)-methyltransferase 1
MTETSILPENVLDLFCGGGGSGNGILEAYNRLDRPVRGTFVNHWTEAIRIHEFNHPLHRHYCTGVDHIQPRELYPGDQKLTLLWASPECTHHSVARGGKPVNEQSRATAWCVVRWIRYKRPTTILIENVREFKDWGRLKQKRNKEGRAIWSRLLPKGTMVETVKGLVPLKKEKRVEVTEIPFKQGHGEHRRTWLKRLSDCGYEMAMTADKKYKGETFQKWVREIRRMGYHVAWKALCSADYGDPTTRTRLFVQAVSVESGRRITWPNPTHAKPDKGLVKAGLLPWKTANNSVIDWSDEGESIFTRKRPLAKKTLYRIAIGLIKYGLKDFIVPKDRGWDGQAVKSVDEPVSTLTCNHRGEALVLPKALEAFHVPHEGVYRGNQPASLDEPLKTVTASHGCGSIARPYVVQMMGQSTAQSVDQPLTAVVGGPKHYVINPRYLVKLRGTSTANDVNLPLGTISTGGNHALVEALVSAFMMVTDQTGRQQDTTYSKDEPVRTVVTKTNQAVVGVEMSHLPASVIQIAHGIDKDGEAGEGRRVKDGGQPLGTIHAGGGSYAVLNPSIVELAGDAVRAVRTAGAEGAGGAAFIVPNFGEADGQTPRTHSVDAPLPVATGHGAGCLVRATLTPFIVGTAHAGDDGRVSSILEPLATICGNRGDMALIRPWIYTFYSGGSPGAVVDAPMPTATTHDRIGLVLPALEFVEEGKFYILDLRFRMFKVRELARAQGFPDDFEFPGTKTDAVKAIGNSVSCGVARSLVLATESQNPDISAFA